MLNENEILAYGIFSPLNAFVELLVSRYLISC